MNYINMIIFMICLLIIGFIFCGLSYILSLKRNRLEKVSAYECGFNAFNDARSGYYVSFYLIALLYILFDIEITLLFPFILDLRMQDSYSFLIMITFILLLSIGFIYEYVMGALDWK